MSGAKQIMDDDDARRDAAEQIAIEAKAVRICEFHPGSFLTNEHAPEFPYQRGNTRMNAGAFAGVFTSCAQMAQYVKAVIDNAMDVCAFPDCPN